MNRQIKTTLLLQTRLAGFLGLLLITMLTRMSGAAENHNLTTWAQLDGKCAIRVVSRLDFVEDQFAGEKPGKNDDQVVIDWMDYAENDTLNAVVNSTENGVEFNGPFQLAEAAFDLAGSVTVTSPSELDYAIALSAPQPQTLDESYLSLRFNQPMMDREFQFKIQPPQVPFICIS